MMTEPQISEAAPSVIPGSLTRAADAAALFGRYPQYRAMNLAELPVIALRVFHVASWGDLSAD